MTAPQPATRVKKARRDGWCPACERPVRAGQQIATAGQGWMHSACFIARGRQQQRAALAAAAEALGKAED